MDAAISLMAEAVVSAADANSSLFLDTPWIDRAISSMVAALSLTALASPSASSLTLRTELAIETLDADTCVVAAIMS